MVSCAAIVVVPYVVIEPIRGLVPGNCYIYTRAQKDLAGSHELSIA